MVKNRCVQALALILALLLLWLLAAVSSEAAGPEFTVWGYVTYDSARGFPVPETAVIVHCNTVVDGGQSGTPPGYPGTDGYYRIEFARAAEQLRIYLETPADMVVIGNSSCAPCGPWGVNLIVCNIPPGHATYNIGPINFFVHYLIPPTPTATQTSTSTPTVTMTATSTSTPTITATATQTSTPTLTPTSTPTPTETPYLMPTVRPEGRPTPDSFLGIAQRELENQTEFLAIFRYFVYGVLGALATMVTFTIVQSKRS